MITIDRQGRRSYLRGDTFAVKDRLRAAGAKWDPDARAWWVGDAAKAAALVADLAGTVTAPTSPEAPSGDTVIAGAATYHGKPARIVGHIIRGRTHWDDQVAIVESRDGAKMLLCALDGSRQWWAAAADVHVAKRYQRPMTLGSIRRFAEETRANGGVHPDACPNCGSTSCSTAYGRKGLCDEN